MPSKIILKNSVAPGGNEKMVIQTSETGGKLRLFPGSNQVVLAAVGTQGDPLVDYGMFRSTNSGDSYETLPDNFPIIAKNLEPRIAVSFNNRYYYVGDPSTIDGSTWIAQSNNGGATWEYKQPGSVNTRSFVSVSSSRDGKYALAANGGYQVDGEVFLTQDFGETWSKPLPVNEWYKTFIDPEGQNMVIGGNQFSNPGLVTQYSNDYGNTWSNFSESLTNLGGVMVSGDGNYKVVWEAYEQGGQKSRVYVSTDWTNWTQNNLTVRLSNGAISNDGKYMLIPSSDAFNSPEPYVSVSSDYGQNWTEIDLGYTQRFSDCAMSADGKYMIVIPGFVGNGYAYKSIDYGETWSQIAEVPLGIYNSVQMSKSGRYVYISGTTEGIIHSTDYMATWTQQYDGSTGQGIFINF
jgi:photosystem II stability/assembly factor-like uncharacterized protein